MTDDDLIADDDDAPAGKVAVEVGTPEGRKRQQSKATLAERAAAEFWRTVFSTIAGRREIWLILHGDMHAFNTDFASGPVGFPDPNATWYRRGEQDMGLRLYHRFLAAEPEGVRLMHEENDPRFVKPK